MAKVKVRRTLKRDSGGYIDESAMAATLTDLLPDFPTAKIRIPDPANPRRKIDVVAHVASYADLRDRVARVVRLTKRDLRPSKVRRGEKMWEQILRNVGAHIEYHEEFLKVPNGLGMRAIRKAKQQTA